MAEATNVINRVDYIYQSEEDFLKGTAAATAVATYLAIESKTRADLVTLRTSLKTYRDSLSDQQLTIYASVNRLYEAIEAEFVGDDAQTGVTLLAVTTPAQDTVTKGAASINSAVEVAIGTDALTDISLFGVVISAAASLSTHVNNLVAALKDSLGSTRIAPETSITVMSCTRTGKQYSLENEIYTTSNDVTKTIYNILACAKWADSESSKDLYFSPTGLVDDCTPLLLGKGFETCTHYLHPTP